MTPDLEEVLDAIRDNLPVMHRGFIIRPRGNHYETVNAVTNVRLSTGNTIAQEKRAIDTYLDRVDVPDSRYE